MRLRSYSNDLAGTVVGVGHRLGRQSNRHGQSDRYHGRGAVSDLGANLRLRQRRFADVAIVRGGIYQSKWVLIAGRTNGLHGFTNSGGQNFPASAQNQDVWVIDPITKQSWHRSLTGDASITTALRTDLTTTNTEFSQVGDRFYVAGGYTGTATQNVLTAIDLPGITDWVINGTGQFTNYVRQVRDSTFQVTGGAMYAVNGRMQLVFGQNFSGGYTPGKDGSYSEQVRSFDIVDDGTTLSFANATASPQVDEYRRSRFECVSFSQQKSGQVAAKRSCRPLRSFHTELTALDSAGGNRCQRQPHDGRSEFARHVQAGHEQLSFGQAGNVFRSDR